MLISTGRLTRDSLAQQVVVVTGAGGITKVNRLRDALEA
jgi:hypothetical protein